jgi:hypothetical protein
VNTFLSFPLMLTWEEMLRLCLVEYSDEWMPSLLSIITGRPINEISFLAWKKINPLLKQWGLNMVPLFMKELLLASISHTFQFTGLSEDRSNFHAFRAFHYSKC